MSFLRFGGTIVSAESLSFDGGGWFLIVIHHIFIKIGLWSAISLLIELPLMILYSRNGSKMFLGGILNSLILAVGRFNEQFIVFLLDFCDFV